jgi:hypothetical protein
MNNRILASVMLGRAAIKRAAVIPQHSNGDSFLARQSGGIPSALLRFVCGKGMSGKPMSTLRYEKPFSRMLYFFIRGPICRVNFRAILPEPANMAEIIRRNQG